jgi:glycosyl hydrolase family 38
LHESDESDTTNQLFNQHRRSSEVTANLNKDAILDRLRKRPFQIFYITHSHIDVGYTHRQEEIEAFQRQFIGQALDLATSPKQADRPDHLKFRFTCEGFWAVEKFLATASRADRDRFAQAVHDGLIELSATYFHLNELLDQGHLRETLNPALDYAREIGHPLEYAGAFDINGFSWGYCDAMAEAGIKYFSTCINTHHGGRPFNKRNVPFYWRGPKDGRVLTWEGQTYHKANLYGLVPLSDTPSGAAFPVGDLSVAEKIFLPKLNKMLDEGYEYDFFPLFAGGLYTDNSPPTDATCEHLAAWNKAYGDVCMIRTATMQEFFTHLQAQPQDIPEHCGDWPDWWADGVACTPHETMLFRNAQRAKRAVERLDPDQQVTSSGTLEEIRSNLWHYAEHTWGHSHAVPLPWDFLSQQMLLRKGEYSVAADRIAMTALDRVHTHLGKSDFLPHRPTHYKVLNPTAVPKTAFAKLPLDFWELSALKTGAVVYDDQGQVVPCQVRPSARGVDVAVSVSLRPDESKSFEIRADKNHTVNVPFEPRAYEHDSIQTDDMELRWEVGKGISAWINRASGQNFVEPDSYPFLAPVYQLFPSGPDSSPQKIRVQAGVDKIKPAEEKSVGALSHVECLEDGPLLTVLAFHYQVSGASMYRVHLTIPKQGQWLGVEACLNKDNVWDPEGIYLAFPIQLEKGQWYLDRVGGPMRPGLDQLPDTCRDYYMVQEGALLSNGSTAIALGLIDAPLVHIGGTNLWDYNTQGEPTGPLLSWQTNNKWETNFKGYCGGFYGFRYRLEFGEHLVNPQAAVDAIGVNNQDYHVLRT